jgi:hypothetical protein
MHRLGWLALLFSSQLAVPKVEIKNQSQYNIVELRIHGESRYENAENILEAPLGVGEMIAPDAEEGSRFITFFREKYERGPILAFTTSRAINLQNGATYAVTIFDESFRVEAIGVTEGEGGCSCSSITRGK